jgi:hypothetical protein
VSAPALASPTTFAFEDCACSNAEEKSNVLIGNTTDYLGVFPRLLPHVQAFSLSRNPDLARYSRWPDIH